MAQPLGALAALAENPGSVPTNHIVTTTCNSSPGGIQNLLASTGKQACTGADIHAGRTLTWKFFNFWGCSSVAECLPNMHSTRLFVTLVPKKAF